jgi:L-2,4-diaminobutyrate decarboxylase
MEAIPDRTAARPPTPAPAPGPEPAAFHPRVLAWSDAGLTSLPQTLLRALDAGRAAGRPAGPLPAGSSAAVLAAATEALGDCEIPEDGAGEDQALARLARVLLEQGIDLSHPHAAAHLQPAPLSVAVIADLLASANNGSLDTYDSGPAGIAVERWLMAALSKLAWLGPLADGVLTPGGSMSNLLGLLLARDAAAMRRGVDARREGVAGLAGPVVFCSELAHFSVHRACAALGLGEGAVCPVPTDRRRRLDARALDDLLRKLPANRTPLAIVATAGTTDFGSIDPLPEVAAIAARHRVWMHVDAAYGFGALFSARLADRLAGLQRADSITLDLHKLGWQPAPASVLLVADASVFKALDREVAYLNPVDDTEAGLDGLLGRSLQTTRRADAVKVAATLLAHGRRGLGAMVDACHALARHAEQRIQREPRLELVSPAELTTVVFRYRCAARLHVGPAYEDALNSRVRRRLLLEGRALIGRTSVRLAGPASPERVCLKLTLLNPTATRADIDKLIDAVLEVGQASDRPGEEWAA